MTSPAPDRRPIRLLSRWGMPPVEGRGRPLLSIVLDTFGASLFLPISLLFFLGTTDLSASRIGLLLTLSTLLSLPFGVLAGEVVQRYGPTRSMIFNNAGSAVGYALYLVVDGELGIFTGMFVVALSERLFLACWPPFLKQLAADAPFESWFSFLESLKAGCFVVGGAIAALAIADGNVTAMKWLIVCNIASSLAGAAILIRHRPDGAFRKPSRGQGMREWLALLRDRPSVLLGVGNILFAPVLLMSAFVFPIVFVRDWGQPAWLVPALITFAYVLVMLAQPPVTRLTGRRPRSVSLIGCTVTTCAALVLLLVHSRSGAPAPGPEVGLVVAVVVTILLTITGMLYFPHVNAILLDLAGPSGMGRSAAFFHTGTTLGNAIAPAFLTWLIAGPEVLWTVLAGISLVSLYCLLAADRMAPARSSEPEHQEAQEAQGQAV
ncbi:MFS transporter [Streptomyces sp. NPDC091287]|uniref:MFS transporter n=1 Tax=Streptomyces sp. NPDC091287 TaxID=3365988 RepID=UPI003812EBA6